MYTVYSKLKVTREYGRIDRTYRVYSNGNNTNYTDLKKLCTKDNNFQNI
jgi:hypothetical protein